MFVEIAVFAAIGLVLDKIAFSMPQGGSVSFVMLPIVMMAIRWGLQAGLTTGLLIGVLQMMFGAYILHWAQALLDYGVAFTLVGLAAVMRGPILKALANKRKGEMVAWIIVGIVIGGFGRFVAHALAGAIFFAEYAGDQNPWIYTILYNGSYMLPAIALTAVVASLLFSSAPRLVKTA